jgi:DNA-binding NarL/FixJ family response regulator
MSDAIILSDGRLHLGQAGNGYSLTIDAPGARVSVPVSATDLARFVDYAASIQSEVSGQALNTSSNPLSDARQARDEQVLTLWREGASVRLIAARLGIAHSTVQRIIDRSHATALRSRKGTLGGRQ